MKSEYFDSSYGLDPEIDNCEYYIVIYITCQIIRRTILFGRNGSSAED